ncbi:MAG: AraC family transcriptional regulator [Opitutaceae bacterium]|jgi:AraC-like DNA-binding protein
MQKRPSLAYGIERCVIARPRAFPLRMGHQPEHGDAPIQRLHVHDCLEIGLCHRGSGIFVIGGKVLPFQRGDVVVISEHEPHFARSTPGTSSSWTWLWADPPVLLGERHPTAPWLSTLPLSGAGFVNLFPAGAPDSPAALVGELIAELKQRDADWQSIVSDLFSALLCRVHRRGSAAKSTALVGGFDQLGPALDYLSNHYPEKVDFEALAVLCGMSLTHFRRRFRATLGKAPHHHLLELRVRAAAAALQDRRKRVTETAFEVGFTTLSSFNRAFQKILGESPRKWRERHRET